MFAARALAAVRSLTGRLRPGRDVPPQLAAALAAFDDGRVAEAEAAFAQAIAETDVANGKARAAIHNKRGVAYVTHGRRDDALEAFACALDCEPAFAPALTNIGSLLFEDGHALDAIDHYRAAIASDEHYPLAYRNLGVALRKIGKRAESVSALRKADRLEARPPRRRE